MKSATQRASINRKWPMSHGYATYNFIPAPPELTLLRTHIASLEEKVEHQAALIATLNEKASHDSLTGLYNRRGMEAVLNDAVATHTRNGRNGSLLMLDLNDFKHINDTHGSTAGDALLTHLAHALQSVTRSTDSLARLGADEFMAFMPESTLTNALAFTRRLRQWLTENPLIYNGVMLMPSLSVGIATLNEAPSLPQLVQLADIRMYRFKQAIKAARA